MQEELCPFSSRRSQVILTTVRRMLPALWEQLLVLLVGAVDWVSCRCEDDGGSAGGGGGSHDERAVHAVSFQQRRDNGGSSMETGR